MIKEYRMKRTQEHIEAIEKMFNDDVIKEVYLDEYIESIFSNIVNKNIVEVIPATIREFQKGLLATVRYKI